MTSHRAILAGSFAAIVAVAGACGDDNTRTATGDSGALVDRAEEATLVDAASPDSGRRDAATAGDADVADSETVNAEGGGAEGDGADAVPAEGGDAEAGEGDTETGDAEAGDAWANDAGAEAAGATDAGTGTTEAGTLEAGGDAEVGATEAGDEEAGAADAADAEAGATEAGSAEAGAAEAGDTEAGATEAGNAEAGAIEAGPCAQVASDGTGGVLDVTTFGANPGGTDAYPGIQQAITIACATSGTDQRPPPVYLPPGQYATSQPLSIQCKNLELYGACQTGTVIAPQFAGPAVLMGPQDAVLPLAPALLGTGSSVATSGNDWRLELRDIPAVELDGLSAFTAEAFIKMTAQDTGYGAVVDSFGCLGGLGNGVAFGCGNAFGLGVNVQNLGGSLEVGGTAHSLAGPTITLNVVHHIALTYDGATIRLFLDGALVASDTASGPVNQAADEAVTIGPEMFGLEADFINGPMTGFIDSVQLSDVARYTAAFTPPSAEPTGDANTLALTNFDTQAPGLTQAISRGQPFWLPVHSIIDAMGNGVGFQGNISLHDFTVVGGMGIVGWWTIATRLYDLSCLGCDYGFAMLGNNYEGTFDHLIATAGAGRSRHGLIVTTANGNEFNDVTLTGQTLPLVMINSAQEVLTSVTINPSNTSTIYGTVLWDTDSLFDDLDVNASGTSAVWRGAVAALEPWAKLQLRGGAIGNMQNGAPPVLLQLNGTGSAGALIQDTSFTGTASAPEILHVVGTVVHPNVLVAATKDSSQPWSDDPGLVTLSADPATVSGAAALPARTPGPAPVQGTASHMFDITAYGAAVTASDNSAAVQAAVDAACAVQGTVFVPVGVFELRQPVLVSCNGVTVEGAGEIASVLDNTTGPSLVLEPAGMTGVDLAPALVGTGQAMQTDGSAYWLELRDSQSMRNLGGLSAFTVEAFIDMSAASAGYGGVVQSHGCLGAGATLPGCTSAFALYTTGQSLAGSLSAGGASYSLQGPTISLGAVHHVALSYDGSMVRLFLDGAVVASAAATGALVQGQYEDVTVGPRTVGFDALASDPAMAGVVDSVRLSNSARYIAAFTAPTTKLPLDSSALVVLNFTAQASGSTEALDAVTGTSWLPVRRTTEPNGTPENALTGVAIQELSFDHQFGVFGMNATHGRYTGLAFTTTCDMVLDGDSSASFFDGLDLVSNGRCGLFAVGGTGSVYHNVYVSYLDLPLVVYGGAGQQFFNLFLTANSSTTTYASYFLDAGVTIEGAYFDNETTSSVFQSNMVVVSPTSTFQVIKGEIDNMQNQGVPVVVDGGEGILFMGTSFGASAMAPEIVHVTSPTTKPNTAVGVTYDPGATLSDDPGFVSIGN